MKSILSFATLVLLFVTSSAFSTTNCKQTFTFLGKTNDYTPTFFIVEELSGECESSALIELALLPNGIQKVKIDFYKKNFWKRFQDNFSLFWTEPFISINQSKGVWKNPKLRWNIKSPVADQKLITQFESEPEYVGTDWNRKNGKRGIQLPIFEGIKTEFIYFLPAGLYVDYEIDRVFFFKKSGFIFVFTTQKREAIGFDTMHGFLVFKII